MENKQTKKSSTLIQRFAMKVDESDFISFVSRQHVDVKNAIELVRKYGPQDDDHGWIHHVQVLMILDDLILLSTDLTEGEIHLARICASLHDLVDHKYDTAEHNSNKRNTQLIAEQYPTMKDHILDIICNCSWSKRRTAKLADAQLTRVRDLVKYADWIDAIRIDRCISYTERTMPNATQLEHIREVLHHCDEKLLHIIDTIPAEYLSITRSRQFQLVRDIERLKLTQKELTISTTAASRKY